MRWQASEKASSEKISSEAAQPFVMHPLLGAALEGIIPTDAKRPVGVISLAAVIGGTPSPSQFNEVSGHGRLRQACRQTRWLRYCTLVRIISYLPDSDVPTLLTATMIATAIPTAIKAYSIEVAPD